MVYAKVVHVRVTEQQHKNLTELADAHHTTMAELIRELVDLLTSKDYIILPLNSKERLFIEGVADTAGVEPVKAVKMVLLSYHTLMSSPLWKIVKPVNEILDEMKAEKDE